jgi:hypothetical protein
MGWVQAALLAGFRSLMFWISPTMKPTGVHSAVIAMPIEIGSRVGDDAYRLHAQSVET